MTEIAEVWCAECDQPSVADFRIKGETIALCMAHIASRFPSELYNPGKADIYTSAVEAINGGGSCPEGYVGCPCRVGGDHWTEAEAREVWGR